MGVVLFVTKSSFDPQTEALKGMKPFVRTKPIVLNDKLHSN
jgi:hypothetical protein